VLQTARDALTVRLENNPGTDRNEVWQRVRTDLSDFLRSHGATGVALHLAPEPPQVNPAAANFGMYSRSCHPARYTVRSQTFRE
jgi:hypothetical protein